MPEAEEPLQVLAKITGHYGIKGWVKLYSYTEPKENITQYSDLQIKLSGRGQNWQDIHLDHGKLHGKGVIAHFRGYDSREASVRLIGAELGAYRSDFNELEEGDYYWADLIGLRVVNLQQEPLGVVDNLIETAAHDVLMIKPYVDHPSETSAEIMIPFVMEHYIKDIDLDKSIITVDWLIEWNDS